MNVRTCPLRLDSALCFLGFTLMSLRGCHWNQFRGHLIEEENPTSFISLISEKMYNVPGLLKRYDRTHTVLGPPFCMAFIWFLSYLHRSLRWGMGREGGPVVPAICLNSGPCCATEILSNLRKSLDVSGPHIPICEMGIVAVPNLRGMLGGWVQ